MRALYPTPQPRAKTVIVAALSGGVVALAIVGLIWGVAAGASGTPESPAAESSTAGVVATGAPAADPTEVPTGTDGPATDGQDPSSAGSSSAARAAGVVDASVTERGLVAEPITDDPVAYGVEAARALVSFDTTRVSREQFARYISGWLGNDPRYGKDPALLKDARSRKIDVVLSRIIGNSERWTDLGLDKSVLTAVPTGAVTLDYQHVEPSSEEIRTLISGGFHLVTVELNVTTTAVQAGLPISITEPVLVTMQINCTKSLPVGDTPQVTGDCKVIQYMTEPTL
jgi:hypothetical protein